MGIMLPILRQNETKNIIRNDNMDINTEQELLNKFKVLQRTLHSPSQLTSPNIFKQHRITSRSKSIGIDDDQFEHRINVKDITRVKENNAREIYKKRKDKEEVEIREKQMQNSKRTQLLNSEMDIIAEQLAFEDMEQRKNSR